MQDQHPKQQRNMRSLHVLTTKFVRLLQEAEDGVMDIKSAAKILAVGQKRRIYDITNVLEGVGLIVKMSRNTIKWMGTLAGEFTQELTSKVKELKSELEDLEEKEYMLDQQKFWVEQSIRNMTDDCRNLTYVNHEDICNCFRGHTLLAVRAPSGTQLDVPIPKAVKDRPAEYQIHLKSINGPIDVLLLNKRSVSSAPVVLPVPPSEEILQSAKSAMSTSVETDSIAAPCQASVKTKHNIDFKQTAMENMRLLRSLSFIKTESNRTDALQDLSNELTDLLQPTKDVITELLVSEVFSPLLRLSPPPSEEEYVFKLDENEGLCDLFDIPVRNV